MARSVDGAAEAAVRKEKLELLPDRVRLTGRDKGLARIAEEAYSWGGFTLNREDEDETTIPAR